MEDSINILNFDGTIIFKANVSENLSFFFVTCGFCSFTNVYYAQDFKIHFDNLVISAMENVGIFNEKPKQFICHKCKCQFNIEKNRVKITNNHNENNNILITKEMKDDERKETIKLNAELALQEETKKREGRKQQEKEDFKSTLIDAIIPDEFLIKKIKDEKDENKKGENKNEGPGKDEDYKENNQWSKQEQEQEQEPKKIKFTFIEGRKRTKT